METKLRTYGEVPWKEILKSNGLLVGINGMVVFILWIFVDIEISNKFLSWSFDALFKILNLSLIFVVIALLINVFNKKFSPEKMFDKPEENDREKSNEK